MTSESSPIVRVATALSLAEIGGEGKDLSGHDFSAARLKKKVFDEAIFNGCLVENTSAEQSSFAHVEFTETTFSNCHFIDCSFDHSDFVLALVQNTTFDNCSFENAEWRDTVFDNVDFTHCKFRNTTTSLTHFCKCRFDDMSASNFAGPSKRFSLFSETVFNLPLQSSDFLKTSFGIEGAKKLPPSTFSDPLHQLSLLYYLGELTGEQFFEIAKESLLRLLENRAPQTRLRIGYLSEICKLYIDRGELPVFGIQMLERVVSEAARSARDESQALQLFHLLLKLQMAQRKYITQVDQEMEKIAPITLMGISMKLLFQKTYQRKKIDAYLGQLARFCSLPPSEVKVLSFRSGSTIVEVVIQTYAEFLVVLKFLKYSLPLTTTVIKQTAKLKKACLQLFAADPPRKSKKRSDKTMLRSRKDHSLTGSIGHEIIGTDASATKPIEVFVNSVNNQVFILGGNVRITVSMTN